MSIVRLDHYNIAPKDMEATVQFYVDVIGLTVGYRPDFGVPGYWLYAGDRSVLHLLGNDERSTGPTGRVDHIAFWGKDIGKMIKRLKNKNVPYKLRTIESAKMHQIFVTDVDGLSLEIGFSSDEPVPEGSGQTFGL